MSWSRSPGIVPLVLVLLVSGCGLFGGNGNNAPIVREIELDPTIPPPDAEATITADVVDGDGDELSFEWSAEAGSFTDGSATTNPATWVAPSEKGTYAISLTVDDGSATAKETISVQVGRTLN